MRLRSGCTRTMKNVFYISAGILFVLTQHVAPLNVTYIKGIEQKSADNFKLRSTTHQTVEDCIIVCEEEQDIMSVEYDDSTGQCVCHSSLPQALTLMSKMNTNIYYNPERLSYIPSGAEAALSIGYIYDSGSHLCYKVHSEKLTWIDAQAECVSEGGILVKTDTLPKRTLVNSVVSQDSTIDYHIGGKYSGENGVWRWVADDSLIPDFTKTGSKDCLEIRKTSLSYDDSRCNVTRNRYICEILLL